MTGWQSWWMKIFRLSHIFSQQLINQILINKPTTLTNQQQQPCHKMVPISWHYRVYHSYLSINKCEPWDVTLFSWNLENNEFYTVVHFREGFVYYHQFQILGSCIPPPLIPRKFSDFSLIINIQTTLTALFSLNDFFILS